jgi:diguanylate cyclase (GGDEF)-like protein/PAS domain S-box-containing protein
LPLVEALFGTLFSLAISAWIYMLLRTQKRAQSIAEKMTRTIKEQMRMLDANVITSETDINGNITAVSQAFCDISGYTKEELLGKDHTIVRHPDMPSSLYEELWKSIKAGKPWKGEIKNLSKDGSYYWVDALITPRYNEEGDVAGYTSLRQDITDKKRIEELSITDRLTGLYNRLKLDELFEAFLHGSERHGTPLSVIIVDIDKFKSVNDTYGHQVGDNVLQEFANLLKTNLRTEDIVGRWGGEEFLILAPGSDLDAAVHLAEKLREKVEAFAFRGVGQKTSSFGVSSYYWGDDEKSMVSRADEALYKAKESGRNRVEHEAFQAAAMSIAGQ